MNTAATFPVSGIVGIVGGSSGEPEAAARLLESEGGGASRPDALEIRADLFDPPHAAIPWVARLSRVAKVIFTLRLPPHGGRFAGDESARIALYEEAHLAGAALLDAEWDSPAATSLARKRIPLLVSHHDFHQTPGRQEIDRITRGMLALEPHGLKLVGTARHPAEALRMLEWTGDRPAGEPRRLGFAMGEIGLFSRVLSIAWGAPYTYAAMGRVVAPGLVPVSEMRGLYRAGSLTRQTRILGVAGNPVAHSLSPYLHNAALQAQGIDAVYLPFRTETLPELLDISRNLGIAGLSVTIPFKEAALACATDPDARARSAGASNTLVWDRSTHGTERLRAYNTDFDGVLEPLRRRGVELRGLRAAIVGAGGAARGAARALQEAGAQVTLYFRNRERGEAVARELGACGEVIGNLHRGQHRLIVNATPLGLHAGDPSPLGNGLFEPDTIAFDMIYDPAETQFLLQARAAGATTLPGREMLISQALVQLELFTGKKASHEQLEAAFVAGQKARSGA